MFVSFSFLSKHGGNSDCYSCPLIFNIILSRYYSQTVSSPLTSILNCLCPDSTVTLSRLRRRRSFISTLALQTPIASNEVAFFHPLVNHCQRHRVSRPHMAMSLNTDTDTPSQNNGDQQDDRALHLRRLPRSGASDLGRRNRTRPL